MNILCFGDSNTFGVSPVDGKRLSEAERWPTLLKQQLGIGFAVIEAGQPNRTLVNNPPFDGDKSGVKYLKPYLEVQPLDVIIIQLGTNDLKARFDLTPVQIAQGLNQLLIDIKSFYQPINTPPKIIILSPPKIYEVGHYQKIYAGAAKKSQQLYRYFEQLTTEHNCEGLDSYRFIEPCDKEGIHLPKSEHKKLADRLAYSIKKAAVY